MGQRWVLAPSPPPTRDKEAGPVYYNWIYTITGNEPGEALRSFGERLRDLRKENPHASEADLKEAVKSAVQPMINRARGATAAC